MISSGILVHPDGLAFLCVADFHSLHGREDGAADGLFRNAIAFDYRTLSLCRGSAVAAHSRDHEGLSALGFHEVGNTSDDQRYVGDAAAADGDCDPHARFDHALQLFLAQLLEFWGEG